MVTKYITKKTGELRTYKPRNNRVIRVDDECFDWIGSLPRERKETDGDVLKRIIKEWREKVCCYRND